MKSRIVALSIFSVLISTFTSPHADESTLKSEAPNAGVEDAVNRFNGLFDNNKINQLYQDFAGQLVRSITTPDAFVAQISVTRSQLGGAASNRSLIAQQFGMDPATKRPLVMYRYKAQFPSATVYEDLTIISEQGSGWKLYGIYFSPIPSQ